ncbi:hypothetical protein COCCADRAFT_30162 [Bipolaris zeicola 26-R-13]|uniref:Protein NO VEIN C-terminal domain-containing protein n=1 Tax=Cochliobolus carbonum (strain 26-R-13) TaxID=930089 RepID=W6Y0T5_COCC2|nr:uncharacterized protein COCCADRAFT_30162 [Bipolaris zeicola 26-R-13]EUC28619.1 hypothetical protein COCCADRAFT_30162 [Bipolaris zeicola 26-R-13]
MRDDGTFDLNSLREALNVGQPRPVPTLAQTEQNHPLRGGPIPNRTDEQKARDFEVGFLGEQYAPWIHMRDTEGALTHQFMQTQHHHEVPDWLDTCCNGGNVPRYRIEVKSTTSRDATTPFYMSGNQHKLAKKLRVTSETPSEIYIILRVFGLDALEEGTQHQPQWKAYMDPYSLVKHKATDFRRPSRWHRVNGWGVHSKSEPIQ